jgi:hypothetical protein
MRDPEYDRFGPWILEITNSDPAPPLFVPHLSREETPLLSIKIPRNIDRRNAAPGMNLYDYVVNLYTGDILILERTGIGGDSVKSYNFQYEAISFLDCSEELLSGILNLYMPEKHFKLPFNTVSSDIIQQLINIIREKYIDSVRNNSIIDHVEFTDKNLSFFFTGLLADERKYNPDNKVLASQTETKLISQKLSKFKNLFYRIVDKRLLESLHLSDGRELKIISRVKNFKYRGQAIYGKKVYYIPVKKIIGFDWKDNLKNPGVIDLSLTISGGKITFSFMQENPSAEMYIKSLNTAVSQ